MKALVEKEIWLLLPTFVVALVLAVVPIWIFGDRVEAGEFARVMSVIYFGVLMMALASFGREFASGTFPLLLALPLTRARIWWTKIGVLGLALAAVFGACVLSVALWGEFHLHYHNVAPFPFSVFAARILEALGGLSVHAIAFLVVFTSGLWTTLLLRQIIAAFWFAMLIPAAILTLILWNGGTALTIEIVLSLYSVAGFCFAWRQFYQAQEVGWTGGEVNLPEWGSAKAGVRQTSRTRRPLAALLWKELQLYKVALFGMAGLFVLHLIVIFVRKTLHAGSEPADISAYKVVLNMFGGIWLIVPLITGSLNIADERRMGTLEAHLCLPVSRRVQFTVKLLLELLLSGFLSALLLWTAEGIGARFNAGGWLGGIQLNGNGLLPVLAIFLGISLMIFYASTLARGILQAIMVAVVTLLALAFFCRLVGSMFDSGPADGPLFFFITLPILVVTLLWLGYANFRRLAETRRLWIRNVRGFALAILFAGALTSFIFNRGWEFFAPLEPAHGPARLTIAQAPRLRTSNSGMSILLPDGRLWRNSMTYSMEHGSKFAQPRWGGGQWLVESGTGASAEANWADAAATYMEDVAIAADGTLWISEKPGDYVIARRGRLSPSPTPGKMIRLGSDANWKHVVSADYSSVVLLKTDGTLWGLGSRNRNSSRSSRFEPYQIGTNSDWSDLVSSLFSAYVWNRDGRAWRVNPLFMSGTDPKTMDGAGATLERCENFDQFKWRSLAGMGPFQLAVRDDGTLWALGHADLAPVRPYNSNADRSAPVQIGKAGGWVSVTANNRMFAALKTDGTLWKWESNGRNDMNWLSTTPPARLGTHSDWVALGGTMGSITALAADGSLWNWEGWWRTVWLSPSRKPTKLDELFARK